jgi:G3E family GTPase
VVHHDLLEGSVVLRRIFRSGELLERAETPLEHGCLSCTVRLDVVPTVARLMDSGCNHVVLGLPPGVATGQVVAELNAGLGAAVRVDNAVLAVDPAEVENQIWDRHTLFESGFTSAIGDDRTSGEFLITELAHVDTVMVQAGLGSRLTGRVDNQAPDWQSGVRLMSQLAPHAALVDSEDAFTPRCYDRREAVSRSRLGSVRVPVQERCGEFCTVLHSVERPLHPTRFREALPRLAAGSHWLRGRLWMASAPAQRIGVMGIGPRVWLENTGRWVADQEDGPLAAATDVDAVLGWHPTFGDRSTVLAVTGREEDIDGAEIRALLDDCQLTDDEMARDFQTLEDPWQLENSL